jgi:microcystin-dependent protein
MARAEIPYVVTKVNGDAVSGASVQINIRNGGPATIYADATSGTTISTAGLTVTTAEGRIEGWLNEGSYDMTVTGTGITTYTQPIEVVRGDGVGLLAANSVGTAQVQDGSITFAKLATTVVQNILPAGTVLMWAGATLPSGGWAWCDGATYNGTLSQYQNLWTAIGTTWGGTGQSAFKVPDVRGRSPIGVGAGAGLTARTLASTGGTETYALAESQIPAHSHTQQGTFGTTGVGNHSHGGATAAMNQNQAHAHTGESGGGIVQNFGGGFANIGSGGAYKLGNTSAVNIDHLHGIFADGAHSHNVTIGGLVTYTGGNLPFPLMQPWVGINFIIKL